MENNKKICLECGEEIPERTHGNANYCSILHYLIAAKKRNKNRYRISVNAVKVLENLKILQYIIDRLGNRALVDSQDLDNAKFNWDVKFGRKYGYSKKLGPYLLTIYDNHKTLIEKI